MTPRAPKNFGGQSVGGHTVWCSICGLERSVPPGTQLSSIKLTWRCADGANWQGQSKRWLCTAKDQKKKPAAAAVAPAVAGDRQRELEEEVAILQKQNKRLGERMGRGVAAVEHAKASGKKNVKKAQASTLRQLEKVEAAEQEVAELRSDVRQMKRKLQAVEQENNSLDSRVNQLGKRAKRQAESALASKATATAATKKAVKAAAAVKQLQSTIKQLRALGTS